MRNIQILLLLMMLTLSCNQKKVGDVLIEVFPEQSKIDINNLPHGQTGIQGFNTITYIEGFSFEKIDEAIYNYLVSKNFNNNIVAINIRYGGKDDYGKDTLGKVISIADVNIEETKKYASFVDWNRKYSLFNFIKDKYTASNAVLQSSAIQQNQINNDIDLPDGKDLTVAQNLEIIVSKSDLKIDQDNGIAQFKFGLTVKDVNKICRQGNFKSTKGKPDVIYSELINTPFYLMGRKVENVTLVYYRDALMQIIVDLPPFDENLSRDNKDSKYITGNEDVYIDLANKYGEWGEVINTGKIDEITEYEEFGIAGNNVRLTRNSFRLLMNTTNSEEGTIMCPGDRFYYTSKLLEDWMLHNDGNK